jgi:DNA-binding MarR family transcriptional regulator
MEQRGLVERRHNPDDRRVVLVHPTEAGLRVFSDMNELRRQNLRAILVRLSEDELKATIVGLRAMSKVRATILDEHARPVANLALNAEDPAR